MTMLGVNPAPCVTVRYPLASVVPVKVPICRVRLDPGAACTTSVFRSEAVKMSPLDHVFLAVVIVLLGQRPGVEFRGVQHPRLEAFDVAGVEPDFPVVLG